MSLKKIEEMTYEEIINLSDDDLQDLIEISCAEKGIQILPKPKKPEEISLEDASKTTCWVVSDIILNSREAIETLESCLQSISDNIIDAEDHYIGTSVVGADGYVRVPTNKPYKFLPEISTLINKSCYEDFRKKECAFNEATSQYKEAMKYFNSSQRQVEDIADPITSTYVKYISIKTSIASLKNRIKRFLTLAKGDKEICMRFFLSTYNVEYSKVSDYFNADLFIDDLLAVKQQELSNANEKDHNA